jgi:hypothetical protein
MFSVKLKKIAKQQPHRWNLRFSKDRIGLIRVPYSTRSKGLCTERNASAMRKAGIVDVLKEIGDVVDYGNLEVVLPAPDTATLNCKDLTMLKHGAESWPSKSGSRER